MEELRQCPPVRADMRANFRSSHRRAATPFVLLRRGVPATVARATRAPRWRAFHRFICRPPSRGRSHDGRFPMLSLSIAMPLTRLRRLLARGSGARPAAPLAVAPVGGDAPPPAMPERALSPPGRLGTPEVQRDYLNWLLAWPAAPRKGALPLERVLALLDEALSTPEACGRLLRRAPNVVPRLVQ